MNPLRKTVYKFVVFFQSAELWITYAALIFKKVHCDLTNKVKESASWISFPFLANDFHFCKDLYVY